MSGSWAMLEPLEAALKCQEKQILQDMPAFPALPTAGNQHSPGNQHSHKILVLLLPPAELLCWNRKNKVTKSKLHFSALSLSLLLIPPPRTAQAQLQERSKHCRSYKSLCYRSCSRPPAARVALWGFGKSHKINQNTEFCFFLMQCKNLLSAVAHCMEIKIN